jgi:hypothetical protein
VSVQNEQNVHDEWERSSSVCHRGANPEAGLHRDIEAGAEREAMAEVAGLREILPQPMLRSM